MDGGIENDYILKVHYGSQIHKLAMLNCRMDCSIYIAVTDMQADSFQIIETGLFASENHLRKTIEAIEGRRDFTDNATFFTHKASHITSPYDGLFSRNGDYYSITNHTGEIKTYCIVHRVLSFEADFGNNRFMMEGEIGDFVINLTAIEEKSSRQVVLFDGQGNSDNKELDVEYTQQYNERDYTRFIDKNNIICFDSDPYSYKLYILNLATGQTVNLDIDDNHIGKKKIGYRYEYIRERIFKQEHSYVAYTCDGPESGCTGLRVLKLHIEKFDAQAIFAFDAYDHKPLNLREPDEARETFLFEAIDINPAGDKAAVMHSASKQDQGHSYTTIYSIYIFDIHDEKAPPKIIDTGVAGSPEFDFICFITDTIVVARFDSFFSFYNIVTSEKIKDIALEKYSGFHVSENYLVYIDLNTVCMVYANNEGRVTKLENPLRL